MYKYVSQVCNTNAYIQSVYVQNVFISIVNVAYRRKMTDWFNLSIETGFNDVNRALPYLNPDLDLPDIIDTETI